MATIDLPTTVPELRQLCGDLAARKHEIEEQYEAARAALDAAARQDMSGRRIGQRPTRTRRRSPHIPLERVRDAVVKLARGGDDGTFTLDELGAELDLTPPQARKQLHREKICDIVEVTGAKVCGKVVLRYLPVLDPGEAFKAQQRLRPHESERVTVERLASNVTEIRQSMIAGVTPKEIREVAREAMKRGGWELVKSGTGDHPFHLEGYGEIVGLPGSPRNRGRAAADIRRRLIAIEAKAQAS